MIEATPIEPAEVVVKPVSSKESVKVLQGKNTKLQKFFADLPIGAVEAVSAAEIPQNTPDTVLISLFGDNSSTGITDPVLKPLCVNLENQMETLQSNLKEGSTSINDLDAAIESAIMQTPGFDAEFSKLAPAEKTAVVKRIREMGVQAIGRRMFMEKAIVSTEATQYSTAKSKYDRIDAELTAKGTEQSTLKGGVGTTDDIATVTAHKQTTERELNQLISQKETLEQKKQVIERQKNQQRNIHIQKGINTATSTTPYDAAAGIAADINIQDYDTQLTALDGKITVIDTGITGKSTNLSTYEKQVSQLQRIGQLDTEISSLKQQLTAANTDMLTGRGELIKRINQLTKDFNGVMPEAAKKALETFKLRTEEANREKTINGAEEKAEKAKKDGDMMTLAEAELTKAFELRYVKEDTQRRMSDFWQKRKVLVTDTVKLDTEYNQIFGTAGGAGTADFAKKVMNLGGTPPGTGSGLSAETIDYLNTNPDFAKKLIEKVRVPLFTSISKQAVMHLDLSETSLRTLASSPDFIVAAKAAVAADSEIGKVIEQVYGAKLGGSRNIGETLKKMPAGGLLGIIMMLFGLAGKGLFTAGKEV